jgi:hypothetical protein
MNRLRDDVGGDPVSDRGIQLLRGTSPTPQNPDLRRRVWMALQRSQPPAFVPRASVIRVFALALSTILFAGTAGAVITARWIVPAIERVSAPFDGERAPALRPAKRAVHKVAQPEGTKVQALLDETPTPAPTARVRTKARTVAAVPHTAAATPQERTQVLDALIALRRDHDPDRAGVLLERYLLDHPRGALREEALVLAIEAADARADHAQARRFARSYQAGYPQGRFRQFAAQHNTDSP